MAHNYRFNNQPNHYQNNNTQASNTSDILFYSNRCPKCRTLITLLQNENLMNLFAGICVDDKLNKLPPQIKIVPTIISKKLNQLLEDNQAFQYIQQLKFFRQQVPVDGTKTIIQQKPPTVSTDPHGYFQMEMGGTSDQFALKDSDMPYVQNYFGYGDEDKNYILTPPTDNKNKLTKNVQDSKIKSLETVRQEQDKTIKLFCKQEQLNSIIKAEQDKINRN